MTSASTREFQLAGFLFAIGSAASFALSGIFASALITAGWSPTAAALVRITLSAMVLLVPTVLVMRGSWHQVRGTWASLVLFGVLAIVIPQLCFFLAIQFIPPSLALLIEFLGPVLLVFYLWARTKTAPHWLTMLGAVLALLGLASISGFGFAGSLHPLGIMFGLFAAVGLASYFVLAAREDHGIAPLPFTGLGLVVAALALSAVGALGLLPLTFTTNPTQLAGIETPWWLTVVLMVLISTVLSYVLGVIAARKLGATVSSFTAYSEALFAILWTILLLAIVPTPLQWLGAALIIVGVVFVKLGEIRRARSRATVSSSVSAS